MHDAEYIAVPLRKRDGTIRTYAKISPEDDRLLVYLWTFNGLYATRYANRTTVYLHREVMGLVPGDGLEVDHRNRDQLDNRRSNLRVVTHAQNHQNRVAIGGASRHRGVHFAARCGLWRARVCLNGHHHHLGYFRTEDDAAVAVEAFRATHMPYSEPVT